MLKLRFPARQAGLAVALAFALLWSLGSAVAQENLSQLKPIGDVEETFEANVPVSGRIHVGLTARVKDKAVSTEWLTAFLGDPGDADRLCLEVTSVDGRYSGRRSYDIADLKAGAYVLPWSGAHEDDLKDYRPEHIAVLAQAKKGDCKARGGALAVTAWGKDIDKTEVGDVFVQLNSNRADMFVSLRLAQGKEKLRCGPIEEEGIPRAAFDTLCRLEAPQAMLTAAEGVTAAAPTSQAAAGEASDRQKMVIGGKRGTVRIKPKTLWVMSW